MKKKKKKIKRSNNEKKRTVRGVISATSYGYAFLSVRDEENDYLIPRLFLADAIDRDTVEAELIPDRRSNGYIARVLRVIKRGRKKICGVVLSGRKVKAFSKKISYEFNLNKTHSHIEKGHWVELEFLSNDLQDVAIFKQIGRAGNIQNDILAIKSEYNLPDEYSKSEEALSGKLVPLQMPRTNFDSAIIFTVDPSDAKDFDDAISVGILDNCNFELGVHIADIAAYIQRGNKFDQSAFERAFTSYLPGRTLTMLPKTLTKKISLTPKKKSLAHSIVMEIDKNTGKVIKSRRFHSIIEVSARLSFDDLEFFIENNRLHDNISIDQPLQDLEKSLLLALQLYRLMRKNRMEEEQFLEIETEFVRAICEEGAEGVNTLRIEKQRDAEKFVEEFMLVANVEAAKELIDKSIPGIFRVHPHPLPEKSREFAEFIKTVCGFHPGDITSRKSCLRFLSTVPDDHRKPVIMEAFLRAMARAYYSENCGMHFGLGKTRYSHFTSPIRRYPDLVIHQQFMIFDLFKDRNKLRTNKELASIAIHCSEKEALNDEAFWAANDILKLHFLKSMIAKRETYYFEAVISRISKNCIFINVPRLGLRGEIPFDLLPLHNKIKNKKRNDLRDGKKHYKPGDFIAVSLANVDIIKGKAIFKPF